MSPPDDDRVSSDQATDAQHAGDVIRALAAIEHLRGLRTCAGVDRLERRLGNLETRVESIEAHVEGIETEFRVFRGEIDRRVSSLEGRIT